VDEELQTISPELEQELRRAMRSFGVDIAFIRVARGFILGGVATTYYGKLMAQELVRKAKLIVLGNHIVVGPGRESDASTPIQSDAQLSETRLGSGESE